MTRTGDRAVSLWLFVLCFMVFGMVAGGGHARSIGAGFAIQVWQPFTGFIPPRGPAAWAHLFALYRQTAQYQASHLTLPQFKALFWPMFLDRVWGRLMALVFAVPLAVFWWRGRVSSRLALWLLAIFAAGGAQAAFGWLMVRTGLAPGVLSPPPAWAAPHFLAAMLIFGALLWTALTVRNPTPTPAPGAAYLGPWLNASIALIFLTMAFGALVAATHAVTVFNTFPTMNGRWIPDGYLGLRGGWLQSQATMQFDHRLLASLTALVTLVTAALGLRAELPAGARDACLLLAGLVMLQYLLGMVTILLGSAQMGLLHELNALLLLTAALIARHCLRGATRPIYAATLNAPAEVP